MTIVLKAKKQVLNIKDRKEVRYIATVDRGRVVEWDKVAEQISLCSSCNKHQIKSMMSAMAEAISGYLSEGHSVRMDDFGTFMPSVRSTPVGRPDQVQANKIYVSFYPSKKLRMQIENTPVCIDAPRKGKQPSPTLPDE